MYSAECNFGLVETVEPESLGVPGKRVFRLIIDGPPPAAATLWLEKEQLYGLSMAVKNLLESEPWKKKEGGDSGEGGGVPFLENQEALEGDSREILEFKVGRLGLAFGPGPDHLTLFFHDDLEEEELDESFMENDLDEGEGTEESFGKAKLQISMKVSQSDGFVKKSLELCASGRGVDAVSRQALVAAGKVNPQTNGHFKH